VIIPIGSTEQHGPNGLIGTDAICPEVIAKGVAEQIDALVAPTINYGMAQHHLGFPGTVSLRPATLAALIQNVVDSLALHGVTHCYFLNGHGGNEPVIRTAFAEIYAAYSFQQRPGRAPHCKLRNWWYLPGIGQYSKQHFGAAEGHHATPSEVSLSYYAHPEAVKQVAMHPEQAPDGQIFDAQHYRQSFPDGRIGSNPALASPEHGAALLEIAVAAAVADYQAFLSGGWA